MMDFILDKTVKEISFDFILEKINPISSYGNRFKQNIKPFLPGMEDKLENELNKIEDIMTIENRQEISCILAHLKDLSETFERANNGDVLDVVEFFEIKNFIFQIEDLAKNLRGNCLSRYEDLQINSIPTLLEKLDPKNDRIKTFYIYDDYSEKLAELRLKRKHLETEIKRERKSIKEEIKKTYNAKINLRNEIIVGKSKNELISKLENDNRIVMSGENYLNLIYTIKNTERINSLEHELSTIKMLEEEEELKVRKRLSKEVKKQYNEIIKNIYAIGKIDLLLAKALFAEKYRCVKPNITKEHIIKIEDGRHLKVEDMVERSGKKYTPISISLEDKVTCITGANMGGKTVALKMVAQIVAATQFGLYVPCKKCIIGLSDFVYISTGDSQSIEEGLSTFGAEISGLKEILENTKEKGLVLIDELARGTNPIEGYVITKAVINYLLKENSISIITTHYDNTTTDHRIQKLQVKGLTKIDDERVKRQLLENTKKGMEIISQYMDYRLIKVESTKQVPKDAIRIARFMGLNEEILEDAERLLYSKN